MKPEIKQRIEQINNGQVPEGYKKTDFGVFPCDWVTKRFGEVCDIYSGGTPNTSVSEYWNGDIPWCTPTDIGKSQKYIFDTEKKITELGLQKSSAVLMPTNSIIMCSRATVGPRSINKVPMATNQGFKNLICKTEYNTEFIYHYIDVMLCCLISKSSGSTFLELSKTTLEKMICTFPKITEQEKIAEILMKWDEAIELQEKYIEKTNQQRTFLLKKVFDPKQNWSYQTLGNNVDLLASGGTPSTKILKYFDGNIIWVSIDDISQSGKYISKSNRTLSLEGLQNSSAKLFPKGTILYAMYASIGKCAIANTDCATSQAILGIIPSKNSFDNQYLYYYLCSIQERISTQGQQGTQANLNKGLVESFKIPTPMKNGKIDIDEQKRISKILIAIDNTITLNTKKLESIKQQRKALQQYLLNGIVRVER